MPPNAPDTDESTRNRFDFERRPLLKALGGGAVGSLGSGVAAASGDESDDADGDDSDGEGAHERAEDGIHPVFGLGLAAGEPVPDGIDPVHAVELDVVEEENAHEGFPLRPDPENPDEFVESPEEFVFDPAGLYVEPGDVVRYENLAHLHTVTAFHEKFGEEMFPMPTRIPDAAPGFTSPIFVGEESWLYRFSEPGVYDILCLPHLTFGMVQRVVVGDAAPAPDEPSEPVPPNAQTVLAAPELEPQRVVENEVVGWDDLTLEPAAPADSDEAEDEAPADLASRIDRDGHWAAFPDDPALWRRSAAPLDFQEGDGRWVTEPASDGGARLRVEHDGGEALGNAGFDFGVGPVGDLESITIRSESVESDGDAARLLVGIYLDVGGDGEHFEWEPIDDERERFASLGGDAEGLVFPLASGRPVTIDADTEVTHFPSLDPEDSYPVTFGEYTSGEVDGVDADTVAALYVGVMGAGAGTVEEARIEAVTVERS